MTLKTMMFHTGKVDMLCFTSTESESLTDAQVSAIDNFLKSRSWIYDGVLYPNLNAYILYRYHGFSSVPVYEKLKKNESIEKYMELIGVYDMETADVRKLTGRDDIIIAKYHIGYTGY